MMAAQLLSSSRPAGCLRTPNKSGTDLPVALRRNRADFLSSHFERTEAQRGGRPRHPFGATTHARALLAGEAIATLVKVWAEVSLTSKPAAQTIVQASLWGTRGPRRDDPHVLPARATPALGSVPPL